MEELDIGPCPFNVGDVVKIDGWLRELQGKEFEIAKTKAFQVDLVGEKEVSWLVAPTEESERFLAEHWDEAVMGEMRNPGEGEMWWWTGFLEFSATRNLEND